MVFRASLLSGIICLSAAFMGCEAPATSDHPLQGRAAPLFTGTLLDEQPFDLANYLGKNVVILDFWATWCGPCRQALPTISEVAARYKDQGVEFFAVDVGENAGDVRKFLDESGLDLTVILDPGAISDRYQVQYLPQTVIIGKDGNVAKVHVGASPDLEAELTQELDALVAEKPTAQAPKHRIEPAVAYR